MQRKERLNKLKRDIATRHREAMKASKINRSYHPAFGWIETKGEAVPEPIEAIEPEKKGVKHGNK